MADFDVIVVGAGPAGSAAALVLARAGHRVCVLERGPFPGAKNMFGGVIYGRVLDSLIPNWFDEAPIQRWVARRVTMALTSTQAISIDYRTEAWGRPPYNGATAYRPDFDAWLATKAEGAGATIVCSTTATGVIRNGGSVIGVHTDRPDGDLRAPIVIAADGVNSFLAKDAGLYPNADTRHLTLGVKETVALDRRDLEQRFGVTGRDGVDIEIVGATGKVPGGGFIYTNLDTISVGVVLKLPDLGLQPQRPEELIAELKSHRALAPYFAGTELKEFSAHLIPEGGVRDLPSLAGNGMLVTGDAASLCLAAGIWLEGVNFAIASGIAAGEAAHEALVAGDTTAAGLGGYQRRLEANFVLRDHRRLQLLPDLVLSPRVQSAYPRLAANVIERLFHVDNPQPKPGLIRVLREERKRAGVRWRDLARDSFAAWRALR